MTGLIGLLIGILILVVFVGLIIYGIRLVPGIPDWGKTLIVVAILIIVLLWLLNHFGGALKI